MKITIEKASKRYGTEYILQDVDYAFVSGTRYVIVGPNGSGKSTLMKMLSGFVSPTRGQIYFHTPEGTEILPDYVWRSVAYAAPYIDLIEEFTMREVLDLHAQTRGWLPSLSTADVIQITDLEHVADREIRYFSSGMKQRVKLAMALCTQAEVVLLDEPTTNLDLKAVAWYQEKTRLLAGNRLVIIASNDPSDLDFATQRVEVAQWRG